MKTDIEDETLAETCEFLLARLAAGSVRRADLVAEAIEAGIADAVLKRVAEEEKITVAALKRDGGIVLATLKRAAKELGIRSRKRRREIDGAIDDESDGMIAVKTSGEEFWELPSKSKSPESASPAANGVSFLKPQEEIVLVRRWREHGDEGAKDKLVTSHQPLVAKIASDYSRRCGLPISDLIQVGNIGLMKGIKGFDPDNEQGARLATYARLAIKGAMYEHAMHSKSLVKMGTTANQRKLFSKLPRAKAEIGAYGAGDLHPDQVEHIAKRLSVTEKDVVEMNRRLGGDASLNTPISNDDGDYSGERQDELTYDEDSEEQETQLAKDEESKNRGKALGEALSMLNERERHIFEARYLTDPPITLEALAAKFRITHTRVHQIEKLAYKKVQEAVKNRMNGSSPAPMGSNESELNGKLNGSKQLNGSLKPKPFFAKSRNDDDADCGMNYRAADSAHRRHGRIPCI